MRPRLVRDAQTPSRADDVRRLGEHVEGAVPAVGPDHVQLAATDVRRVVVADEAGAGGGREGAVGDPLVRLEGRATVDRDRAIAEKLLSVTQCDVTARMNELGPDLTSVWRRAFRYRAEREATANALRVREGKSIETASRCSDGGWMFDGTTLRFSREIATAAPDRPMPLVLRIKP